MQIPYFNPAQYVDALLLNSASSVIDGSFVEMAAGLYNAYGFVHADLATINVNAGTLTAYVALPAPFQLVSPTNGWVSAHGTISGQDTQTTLINFSGVVPASGSQTVYVNCSVTQITQNPVAIPGPPIGHPDYNPTYVGTYGNTVQVDTLNVFASATPPDDFTTFGLWSATLAAGATTISGFTSSVQQIATLRTERTPVAIGGGQPAVSSIGLYLTAAGTPSPLPVASGVIGQQFNFTNTTSGAITVSTTGTDKIFGPYYQQPGVSAATCYIPPGQTATFWAVKPGLWHISGGNLSQRASSSAGNPNGIAAGFAGTAISPPDLAFDYIDSVWYYCATGGAAGAASWLPISPLIPTSGGWTLQSGTFLNLDQQVNAASGMSVGGTFFAGGVAAFGSAVGIAGNLTLQSTLTSLGAATFGGFVSADVGLAVTGAFEANGPVGFFGATPTTQPNFNGSANLNTVSVLNSMAAALKSLGLNAGNVTLTGDIPGKLIATYTITAVGVSSFTPPSACTSLIVEMQAAGGAGGGVPAITTTGQAAISAPGSAGSYAMFYLGGIVSGATPISYTLGGAGVGGVSGVPATGGATTTFGSYCSCPGGLPGVSGASQASGTFLVVGSQAPSYPTFATGIPAPYLVPMKASTGGPGTLGVAIGAFAAAGTGGNAVFGPGGLGGVNGESGGTGSNYGGGGGGAANIAGVGVSGQAQTGGYGAPGIIIIYAYT